MIGVFVVLACLGLLFFALVETAFGLLMRLPHRLEPPIEIRLRLRHDVKRHMGVLQPAELGTLASRNAWTIGLHPFDDPVNVFQLADCPITDERVVAVWRACGFAP